MNSSLRKKFIVHDMSLTETSRARSRPEFETVLAAVRRLDHDAAVPFQRDKDLVVDMLLRRGFGARQHVDHENGHVVAAALEMHERALAAFG
jgi:hypothetical protein